MTGSAFRTRLLDRLIDAVDEWFHRRGLGVVSSPEHRTVHPWWGWFVLPLCDYRERRIMGDHDWFAYGEGNATTSSNSAPLIVKWKWTHRA
jgi:hypothetical protein